MKKLFLSFAFLIGFVIFSSAQNCENPQELAVVISQLKTAYPGLSEVEPPIENPEKQVMKVILDQRCAVLNGKMYIVTIYQHSILGIRYGKPWRKLDPVD